MRVRVGAASDVGVVREQNEDSYLASSPLFAVADGMGGHQGGEVASQLALERVEELHRDGERPDLGETVHGANQAVLERAAGDEALSGMGTTLTLLRMEGTGFRLAHVGDSRAYRLRDGELEMLTEDHTLVNRMVQEGKLTEDEARIHPHRSILTRALGVETDLQVDLAVIDAEPGDRVLLCSDGLTGVVGDERIKAVLQEESDPQAACDVLVAEAIEAGGPDNVTVVVLDFLENGEEAAPAATPAAEDEPADEPEAPPPADEPPGRRRRWPRLLLWLGLLVLVLVLAGVGTRMYLNTQWFVGEHEGNVALFRGIPTEVLGYDLFTLEEETDIPAARAAGLQPYAELPDGIPADSEEEARALIAQMEEDLRETGPSP